MSKEQAYSKEKLQEFKSIIERDLNRKRKEILDIRSKIENRKGQIADSNLDFNENSQHFQTQAKNENHFRRLSSEVQDLEDAMKRIEDKSYGISEQTGKKIREARLKAMPTATFDINQ